MNPRNPGDSESVVVTIHPYKRDRHGDVAWHIVSSVFDEYGFPFAENDYDADLADPAKYYDGHSGWFAIAEDGDGWAIGCIGLTDEGDGLFELHRLYVLAEQRKSGAGSALVGWVLETARERGARKVILYSDTHFRDAHRLYERFGFVQKKFRYAPDPWQSREWGYELDMTPAEQDVS